MFCGGVADDSPTSGICIYMKRDTLTKIHFHNNVFCLLLVLCYVHRSCCLTHQDYVNIKLIFRTKLSEDDERLSGDSGLRALTKDEAKTKRAIEEINFCLDRPHLLYVYERESGVEINKAIFDALKQGE